MAYQTFTEEMQEQYPVVFLSKELNGAKMEKHYIERGSIAPEDAIAFELYTTGKKTSAADMKTFMDDMAETLEDAGTNYVFVADAAYFKLIAGVAKADPYAGYVLPNKYPEDRAGQFNVLYIPSHRQVFHAPEPTLEKIDQALEAYADHVSDSYTDPGTNIIDFAEYPHEPNDIRVWLDKLLEYPELDSDIEGFSLKHYEAGIGTITFTWSTGEGIAFPVDLGPDGKEVRNILRAFFVNYRGRINWHNASYDVTVLIYQLFMDHLLDTNGLLHGLNVFLRDMDWDDTKLIIYLATNSTAGNVLGLKENAQEFAGNYAQEDIKDITKIPLPELLQYNLVDGLSTRYVKEKYEPKMDADGQREIYETLFKPAVWDIIHMQLTGLPLDMEKVQYASDTMEADKADAVDRMQSKPIVANFLSILNEEAEDERYADWCKRKDNGIKVKPYKPGNFDIPFKPGSGDQLQRLFYDILGLPVLDLTDTKQPATGADTLEKLKAYTEDPDTLDLINALLDYKAVEKILTAFIPPMLEAPMGPDGWHYLFGNFNLGGTVSGRLSSSGPNLQTIPANGDTEKKRYYAKLIKDCFRAPPGYVFVGLDFASLEDRISALTTRDPNKLAVYTDGFDGHCLRAQSYFAEDMPDIERAPEDAECFKAMIGDTPVFFHADEKVTYLGQSMTGQELWDRLSNQQLAA